MALDQEGNSDYRFSPLPLGRGEKVLFLNLIRGFKTEVNMPEKETNKANWYPVRVLYGKTGAVKKTLDEDDIEYYYPMRLVEKEVGGLLKYVEEPLVRSLIFINTTPTGLQRVKTRYSASLIPYYGKVGESSLKAPVTVPGDQMERFIKLCEMKEAGLEYLGEDEPKYHLGDKVRVTEGIFKGFEGHIKRIRHDRKLIVTIEGVAAFATRFIPPSMLEKI